MVSHKLNKCRTDGHRQRSKRPLPLPKETRRAKAARERCYNRCGACQDSHLKCDGNRPCSTCLNKNKGTRCVNGRPRGGSRSSTTSPTFIHCEFSCDSTGRAFPSKTQGSQPADSEVTQQGSVSPTTSSGIPNDTTHKEGDNEAPFADPSECTSAIFENPLPIIGPFTHHTPTISSGQQGKEIMHAMNEGTNLGYPGGFLPIDMASTLGGTQQFSVDGRGNSEFDQIQARGIDRHANGLPLIAMWHDVAPHGPNQALILVASLSPHSRDYLRLIEDISGQQAIGEHVINSRNGL